MGHPQSQGAAERFNRTLLTLIRKTVQSRNLRVDLDMILFYYRTRPHSGLGVSPMMAMYDWETRDLIVESHSPPQERFTYTPEFLCGHSPKIIVQLENIWMPLVISIVLDGQTKISTNMSTNTRAFSIFQENSKRG